MKSKYIIWLYPIWTIYILISGVAIGGTDPGITAITIPSADVTLSFVQPGKISAVLINEGDAVAAGQLLVKQDDTVEQIVLTQSKLQSEDTSQIEAAQASLEQKKTDLKKLEWAASRESATELEVEHARLEVKIADLSLKVAQFEHEQNARKYQEWQARVDRMGIKSPTAGTINVIHVEEGEAVNAMDNVVQVVKTDPLWIDTFVPLQQSRTFIKDHPARILFPGNDEKEGKVIYVSTVADAASSTLRVRIEVPNKENRPAGEHVKVFFPNTIKVPEGRSAQ